MLLCFLAHSQEAENLGSYAEVSIIPRLDLNPYYSSEDSKLGFTHGNSSIYTLFEGSVGEHFSWTVANHWLSSLNEPATEDYNYAWPYKNLGYSNDYNWIDYLKVDLTFGNWTFTLGKTASPPSASSMRTGTGISIMTSRLRYGTPFRGTSGAARWHIHQQRVRHSHFR